MKFWKMSLKYKGDNFNDNEKNSETTTGDRRNCSIQQLFYQNFSQLL